MSIYYGYKCLDCNKGSDHWFNHAIGQLRVIYTNREHFIKIWELQVHMSWIYQIGISNDPGICEWLYDHRKCSNVLIEDEYGRVYSIDEVKELTIYDKIGISKEVCDVRFELVIKYIEELEQKLESIQAGCKKLLEINMRNNQ